MSVRNLLFEIGSEEIPAGYISPAREQLKKSVADWITEQQLTCREIVAYSTPRRLTVFVQDLAEKQEESEKLFIGPPARVAFDAQGNLTKAGLGFAKTQNVDPSVLIKTQTDKGEYLSVQKKVGGALTMSLLPGLIGSLLQSLAFPKSMNWETSGFRYARPLRWILALYGSEVIPFELAGVQAGHFTYGHGIRTTGKLEIQKADLDEYKKTLESAFVIVDQDRRKAAILEQLIQMGTWDRDEDLLEVVTNLVESPKIIQGDINPEFLKLPQEVLITSMKHHQKYFPMITKDGVLQPHFLSVHNSDTAAEPNIKEGNERVIKARLSDAQFFWNEDTKTTLESKFPKLSGFLFQAKLGNYDKKAERIVFLTGILAQELQLTETQTKDAVRAAKLCKIDLITELVKEFTDLQGTMGKYYALHDGENPSVAQAIVDHYLPKGSDAALPQGVEGSIVSLADKLDSIVGCFGVGLIPTGSEDPFALRRAANGIVRIIVAYPDWNLNLDKLIAAAAHLYVDIKDFNQSFATVKVKEFLQQRVRGYLIDNGIRYDSADAVIMASFNDINETCQRAKALQEIRSLEDFQPLTIAFKRVINILKQAREKYAQQSFGQPDTALFEHASETDLHQAVQAMTAQLQGYLKQNEYLDALKTIAVLRKPVDAFFDGVMVLAEDEKVRTNRLALLEEMETQFRYLADFTQLVIEV